MNKILFFTCFLLVTTPAHSMNPPKTLFTDATNLKKAIKHFQLIVENKPLSLPKVADPNVYNVALAIALYENDKHIAPFLLAYKLANPSYIVNPALMDIIKSDFNSHTNHSENERNFFKLKDQSTFNHPEGLPAYYLTQDPELVDECMQSGADLSLGYSFPTPYGIKHGNIITYIIDNPRYEAALIQYYLSKGAGAYAQSYVSKRGSTLHHLVHILSISNDQEIHRLYECARYLIEAKSDLLNIEDCDGNTPGFYLTNMKHPINKSIIEQFAQLFEQHSTAANQKKSRE